MKTRLKRYTGSLIDFLLFILFFYLFTLFFSNVIVPNNPTYQANSEKMNEIMLSSGLFEENSKGDIVDIDDNYDEVLTKFYKTYPYVDANKDHFSSYEDAKRKSGLFHEVSDGVFVVNEDASELDLGIFYTSQLYNAKVSLFNYSDYKNYYDYNNNLIYWGSIGCIVLSSAIFYLILPLFLFLWHKYREFEIEFETCKLPVIDDFYINGGFLFKETVCCDSHQRFECKVSEWMMSGVLCLCNIFSSSCPFQSRLFFWTKARRETLMKAIFCL